MRHGPSCISCDLEENSTLIPPAVASCQSVQSLRSSLRHLAAGGIITLLTHLTESKHFGYCTDSDENYV